MGYKVVSVETIRLKNGNPHTGGLNHGDSTRCPVCGQIGRLDTVSSIPSYLNSFMTVEGVMNMNSEFPVFVRWNGFLRTWECSYCYRDKEN